MPNAHIQKSPSQSSGETYACANGTTLQNLGQTSTDVRLSSPNGRSRNITWQNVKIEFPIISTSGLAEDPEHESEMRYRKDGGNVVELADQHHSKFVRHGDVYFMKVYLRKSLMKKPEGFARPGAAP